MPDNEPKHTSRNNSVCMHGLTYTPNRVSRLQVPNSPLGNLPAQRSLGGPYVDAECIFYIYLHLRILPKRFFKFIFARLDIPSYELFEFMPEVLYRITVW